jgi:hypothetical protein
MKHLLQMRSPKMSSVIGKQCRKEQDLTTNMSARIHDFPSINQPSFLVRLWTEKKMLVRIKQTPFGYSPVKIRWR